MPAGVAQNGLPRIHYSPVNNSKAAILISDPQKPQILSGAHRCDWRSNFLQRELLHISLVLAKGIEAKLFEEAELIGYLTDEL